MLMIEIDEQEDLKTIKAELSKLQAMDNLADIVKGLERVKQFAELVI